jgi:hypothetical protein
MTMDITFFDNPLEGPQSRDTVRLKQIGLFVYEDLRRVAVGLELTRFVERPSIEITITNARGETAGSLNVIETLTPNFTLTMHLRDREPTDTYELTAQIYYSHPEKERENYHHETITFDASRPGEQIFKLQDGQ